MTDIAMGRPEPIGVTPLAEGGVNVAVVAPDATAVWFCVFEGARETRHALRARTSDVWHAHVPHVGTGARYGLRAAGPWDPANGHRFNPAKLLIDPWARVLTARPALHAAMFDTGDRPDGTDSSPFVPKALVAPALPPAPALGRQRPCVIYELHVRGFTRLLPGLPDAQRGTFAALGQPAAIAHLRALGITHVELMPAAASIDERHLPPLGLTNYWGYNPIAMLAPDPRLAPGGWPEVRQAIAALHAAGIGVILDVVLNHTGEGDELGPTLSLRGLANAAFHRLHADDPRRYVNDTGCGNTLALDRPWPLRLAMDALRAWADAGLDGFRLDLATTLARRAGTFDADAPLIQAMRQDPALRQRWIIAEPWDLGAGGYRLGGFPAGWGEWNDRFRDDVRRFWRGDAGTLGALATRLAGSADVFAARHRRLSDSINFIAAHDGFTLRDLVSYRQRRNEANGEGNRDGRADNLSWNHGVEGPADDDAILARRQADVRALLATLLLSRGTPMLTMGDEGGRTQHGNNNAYAQDNPTSWLDWSALDRDLVAFCARLIALRRAHPALHDDSALTGEIADAGDPDIVWMHLDGQVMRDQDWAAQRSVAAVLTNGADRVLLCVHGSETPAVLTLPDAGWARAWRIAADSAAADRGGAAGATLALHPRSVVLLHATDAPARPGSAPDATLLAQLARSAGIQTHWHDLDGRAHAVPRTTIEALLRAMAVPAATAAQARESHAELSLAPRAAGSVAACFLPEGLAAGERRFGIAAQTYALRRTNDQGVGDYTALARLAVRARDAGATWLGVSPPHALMPADRMRASPYQPSDRRFLEPVLLDVSALGELQGRAEVRAALARAEPIFAALRAGGLVDYPAVWQAKDRVLRAAWAALPGAPALHEAFRAFRAQGGPILDLFAAHGAIADQLCHTRVDAPGSPMVRSWMAEHAEELGYRAFLQFLCDRQLAQSAAQGVGLYRDLAVGCAPDGAEAWSQPDRFLRGFSVGAPPDRFAPAGQVWGLPPPDPRTAAPMLAELLRANMRHAAALRIDHVMGLRRLFVVPDGATGAEGCYLAYPFEALLTEVARASMAARCAVVGEDLGTVPDGLRAALHEARVLSYRVLWFERDGNDFVPPASWPAQATACVSTHDLPTLAGWWQGTDITERAALGLADAETGLPHRAAERAALCRAMGCAEDAAFSPDIAAAVHAHVAAAPCAMMLVQAEDLAGETVAVNLPGTDRERPNWRRRLALDVDALAEGPTARAILAALAARRR